jgi:hypothetical protein
MNPDQLNALGTTIKEAIAAISEKLGVATSHVYEVLVRQQFVEGVVGVLAPVSCIIFALIAWNLGDSEGKSYKYELGAPISQIIFGVIAGVMLLLTVLTVPGTIGKLLNPEYYALKDITEQVGQLVK